MTMVKILALNSRPYSNTLVSLLGGMDAYVREFSKTQTHDDFYTDQTIRGFFENYLKAVVSRYVDSTTLLGWELANDPRCSSSIASSPSCTTETITLWHSEIAQFIVSIDPNHLVTSGFVHFRTQPGFPSNFYFITTQKSRLLLCGLPQVIFRQDASSSSSFACSRRWSQARSSRSDEPLYPVPDDHQRETFEAPCIDPR